MHYRSFPDRRQMFAPCQLRCHQNNNRIHTRTALFDWSIALKDKTLRGDLCQWNRNWKVQERRAIFYNSDVGIKLFLDGVAELGAKTIHLAVIGKRGIVRGIRGPKDSNTSLQHKSTSTLKNVPFLAILFPSI